MKIQQIVVGPLQTNCYLVWGEGSREGTIIDPGADAEKIARAVTQSGVTPMMVVNTHAHYDHIGANPALKRLYPGLQFAVGALDAASVSDPMENLGYGLGFPEEIPPPDLELEDGDTVGAGECFFRVINTPGHTKGAISLVSGGEAKRALFCGDLIFEDGVGRTDLPGGDAGRLRESIDHVLSSYPDDTVLYPGHGPSITIGERKKLQ